MTVLSLNRLNWRELFATGGSWILAEVFEHDSQRLRDAGIAVNWKD